MGAISRGGDQTHRKQGINKDRLDDLLEWGYVKDKDLFDKQIDINQEIINIAKAKNDTEENISQIGLYDYYILVNSYLKHFQDQKSEIQK